MSKYGLFTTLVTTLVLAFTTGQSFASSHVVNLETEYGHNPNLLSVLSHKAKQTWKNTAEKLASAQLSLEQIKFNQQLTEIEAKTQGKKIVRPAIVQLPLTPTVHTNVEHQALVSTAQSDVGMIQAQSTLDLMQQIHPTLPNNFVGQQPSKKEPQIIIEEIPIEIEDDLLKTLHL